MRRLGASRAFEGAPDEAGAAVFSGSGASWDEEEQPFARGLDACGSGAGLDIRSLWSVFFNLSQLIGLDMILAGQNILSLGSGLQAVKSNEEAILAMAEAVAGSVSISSG